MADCGLRIAGTAVVSWRLDSRASAIRNPQSAMDSLHLDPAAVGLEDDDAACIADFDHDAAAAVGRAVEVEADLRVPAEFGGEPGDVVRLGAEVDGVVAVRLAVEVRHAG